ncbi:MAG: SDR family oxidoreductase [Pseudomonadota bacterium]
MANILITGANRGIGLEMARAYAARGDSVIAGSRNPADATELAAIDGVRVEALDVSDPGSIKALAIRVGDAPIDVLVNNAGIVGGAKQSLAELDIDAFHEALDTNTIGPLLMAQAFKDNLAASGNGKLMTVTSQLGAMVWPMGGSYIYGATKAAVNRIVRALAIDWKDEPITVALVHPGWVQTDMGGPKAEITPVESATGIIGVIDGLTPEDAGKFYKWNGEPHAF